TTTRLRVLPRPAGLRRVVQLDATSAPSRPPRLRRGRSDQARPTHLLALTPVPARCRAHYDTPARTPHPGAPPRPRAPIPPQPPQPTEASTPRLLQPTADAAAHPDPQPFRPPQATRPAAGHCDRCRRLRPAAGSRPAATQTAACHCEPTPAPNPSDHFRSRISGPCSLTPPEPESPPHARPSP